MKKTFLFAALLLNFLPSSQASYKYKKYRKHEPESGGFVGTKITAEKGVASTGLEYLHAHSIFYNCFLGVNIGTDERSTTNTYGAARFGNDNYGIVSATLGLSLDYRLFHNKRFSLFTGCMAGYEVNALYDDFNTSGNVNVFLLFVNGSYSLRPGIGFSVSDRFACGIGYKFLIDDVTNFGSLKDFEGPQIMLSMRDRAKHRHYYY